VHNGSDRYMPVGMQ